MRRERGLPEGRREARLTITTDNGTQFTSTRFIETLNRLGITHRRTAYHHPEGNSYIERFHRSLKEEEVWTAEYRNIRSGLERRREHNFLLAENLLSIYMHRGGRDATYFDFVADAERRLDYIEVRVDTDLPSNAFLLARQPLNEMLDVMVRNPPHPALVIQRLELVSPNDGGILGYEVTLPS